MDVEVLATNHYMELLGELATWDFTLNMNVLGLSVVEATNLELPFSEVEIGAAIRALPLDKSPGPDGFTARLYQSC
jgi:hypothetical protein